MKESIFSAVLRPKVFKHMVAFRKCGEICACLWLLVAGCCLVHSAPMVAPAICSLRLRSVVCGGMSRRQSLLLFLIRLRLLQFSSAGYLTCALCAWASCTPHQARIAYRYRIAYCVSHAHLPSSVPHRTQSSRLCAFGSISEHLSSLSELRCMQGVLRYLRPIHSATVDVFL